jgi:hypothetical protein
LKNLKSSCSQPFVDQRRESLQNLFNVFQDGGNGTARRGAPPKRRPGGQYLARTLRTNSAGWPDGALSLPHLGEKNLGFLDFAGIKISEALIKRLQ